MFVWVYRRKQNSFTKASAFTLSQLPLLLLGEVLDQFFYYYFLFPPPLWRGCCRFELGAGPADIHTLWVPDRCYLSNVLKVFGFAKSRAVPQHKHMGLLTHGAWQCSAAKAAVKLRFYHDRVPCLGSSAQVAPQRSSWKGRAPSGLWGTGQEEFFPEAVRDIDRVMADQALDETSLKAVCVTGKRHPTGAWPMWQVQRMNRSN